MCFVIVELIIFELNIHLPAQRISHPTPAPHQVQPAPAPHEVQLVPALHPHT